jgi:hypothetical protein
MEVATVFANRVSIEGGHIEDIRLASTKMTGAARRAFQAEMATRYCDGIARRAEDLFGWSRQAVQLGLHEKRCGIVCLGHHEFCCGAKLWEEKHPEVAQALWKLAASHSQQDPTFRTPLSFTRLTAKEALKQLQAQGFVGDERPARSGMSKVLNRNGYRRRPVIKAKPQKSPGNRRPLRQDPGA